MNASSTAGSGVRALIVPFVVPPYPLRQGYRDYPDAVASGIPRSGAASCSGVSGTPTPRAWT